MTFENYFGIRKMKEKKKKNLRTQGRPRKIETSSCLLEVLPPPVELSFFSFSFKIFPLKL